MIVKKLSQLNKEKGDRNFNGQQSIQSLLDWDQTDLKVKKKLNKSVQQRSSAIERKKNSSGLTKAHKRGKS